MRKILISSLTLSGMIIGAGMFGIPFALSKSGFWPGVLELWILAGVVLALHLTYSEVVIATAETHRLPGYVKKYLGAEAFRLSKFSAVFGITGSLLAYLILGSIFLNNIFKTWFPEAGLVFWVIIIGIAAAAITFFNLKKESLINGLLTAALVLFTVFLVFMLWPDINNAHWRGFSPSAAMVPYGILLFSLSGGLVIPEVVILSGKSRRAARISILLGSLIPAVIYLFFAAAVLGVSGNNVSEDAISGLYTSVGGKVVAIGSLIGFLAVFTSLVAASKNFQELLRLDMNWPKPLAWLAVSVLPLFFYFAGFKNFIGVIGAVGAVGVGVDSALIIGAFHRLRKKQEKIIGAWPYVWKAAIYVMILVGVVYEILNWIKN